MTKIITFGVFDFFHYGHLLLLEQAKELGDYLIVAVQEDKTIKKYKPDDLVLYSAKQRIHILKSLKIVDEVVLYSDVDKDISKFDFNVFAVGEDQIHDGFKKAEIWCEQNNKRVVHLKYTKGLSSKEIKERINAVF